MDPAGSRIESEAPIKLGREAILRRIMLLHVATPIRIDLAHQFGPARRLAKVARAERRLRVRQVDLPDLSVSMFPHCISSIRRIDSSPPKRITSLRNSGSARSILHVRSRSKMSLQSAAPARRAGDFATVSFMAM